jgi:hypothetical protein
LKWYPFHIGVKAFSNLGGEERNTVGTSKKLADDLIVYPALSVTGGHGVGDYSYV